MNNATYAVVAVVIYFLWLVHLTVVAKRTKMAESACLFLAAAGIPFSVAWIVALPLTMLIYGAYGVGSFIVRTIERKEKNLDLL